MTTVLVLLALAAIGIVARSPVIAVAAGILLFIKLANLQCLFAFIERQGLEIGLLFLLLTIMVPLGRENVDPRQILKYFTTLPGFLAILGGALATHLNYEGLRMLQLDPEMMFGLIIGSVLGILLFNGIPVGPLMAAGLTALFIDFFRVIK